MAQVDQAALHNFVNGETVTDQMLDQNFEIVRVAQNETDTKTATHKNSVILDHPDKSVTTAKLADKAVTFDKLGVDLQASLDLEKEWTATANQTVFDLSDVGTYPVGVHAIEFIIGGVPQSESAYIQSSPTTITTVEGVAAGVKVRAKWRMGLMPTTTVGHQSTHQQGGLDELDITTLKNYQPLIADKLGNLSKKISFYDLKVDFGAVGDGVTDDSAALQLARDTMNSLSNGGTLFIPAGRYISRTAGKWLITNPNVFIGGQSKKSSIIDANNDLNFSFNIRANGVTLYDFGIEKPLLANSAGNYQPVYVLNWDSSTNIAYNVSDILIDHMYIKGGMDCIKVGYGGFDNGILEGTVENVTVQNCELYSNQDGSGQGTCIHGRFGNDCKYLFNLCNGGEMASSINLYGHSNSLVQGNTIYYNRFAGIEVENSPNGRNVITDNKIYNTMCGIWVDDSKHDVISNNLIVTNTDATSTQNHGIRISSSGLPTTGYWTENTLIEGNLIVGFYEGIKNYDVGSPVSTDAKISNITIANNKIYGCSVGIEMGINTQTFGFMTGVTIADNRIKYNNSVKTTTLGNGIQVNKMVDDITIDNNKVQGHNYNVYVDPNTTSNKIYVIDNKLRVSSSGTDIYAATAGNAYFKDNLCDGKMVLSEYKFVDYTSQQASGNHSIAKNYTTNNYSEMFSSSPRIRVMKNNYSLTITKGTIVKLDTSYIWGTFIVPVASGSRNDNLVIGVTAEDITAGSYGRVVEFGLCDVTTSTAISAGNFLTNLGTQAVAVTTGDRNMFIALDTNDGTTTKTIKALFINR